MTRWVSIFVAAFMPCFGQLLAEGVHCDLTPLVPRGRSASIMPVMATFRNTETSFVEGRLSLTFKSVKTRTPRICASELLTLPPGETRRLMTLPTWAASFLTASAPLEASFQREDGAVSLGTYQIPLSQLGTRSVVVALGVADSLRSNAALQRLGLSLFLEGYDLNTGSQGPSLNLRTRLAITPADELPDLAVGYCAYDVVLLSDSCVAALRKRQIKALENWVRAGGSLCLFIDTEDLKSRHALNMIIGESRIGSSERGKKAEEATARLRNGLGRIVVFVNQRPGDVDIESKQWLGVVAFLWKMKTNWTERLVETGKWNTPVQAQEESEAERKARRRAENLFDIFAKSRPEKADKKRTPPKPIRLDYAPRPASIGANFAKTLLPARISLLPFGVIAIVMGVYLVIVGPLDYFALGWLKLRWLTWILFPLVSVVALFVIVWLARARTGAVDIHHHMTIIDVGDGNRVLRQTRFDLWFPAKGGHHVENVKHAIACGLNYQRFSWDDRRYGSDVQTGTPMVYDGRFYENYTTTFMTRHWTPSILRRFEIPTRRENLLPWDRFDPSTPEGEDAIKSELEKVFGALPGSETVKAEFHCFHRGNWRPLWRSKGLKPDSLVPLEVLRTLCARTESGGIFTLVSAISPTGGPNFEDLTVLDDENPKEYLLVCVVKRGGDVTIYRKLRIVEGT